MIPWICSDNKNEILNSMNKTQSQILCGHLELSGFEMQRGHVNQHGMELKVLDKFDIVMSGHYHHKSSNKNIHYLGCPYEMDWSDYNDDKGFHIFDTDTREIQFIKNENKMYYKIVYDDINDPFDVFSIDYSVFSNKIIKIVIKNKKDPFIFDKFINGIEKNNINSIQVVEDYLNVDDYIMEDSVNEAEDTLTIFKNTIQQMTNINVDKKKLNKLAYELYQESVSIL